MRNSSGYEKYFLLAIILSFLVFYLFRFSRAVTDDRGSVPFSISQYVSGESVNVQLPQNHQMIIDYIWDNHLIEPPSKEDYNIKDPSENPSRGQGQFVQKIFRNSTKGFFVECGALDGETRSNSLWLETNLGWTGLLVEGDPKNYGLVKQKHRKAWISNTCLATKPFPHQVEFVQDFNLGRIFEASEPPNTVKRRAKKVKVQCMPLFSLLAALKVTTVDYFSLDVEGSELQVLKTIPFDEVHIKSLSVEFFHTVEGKQSLLDFMESKGYKVVGEVHDDQQQANDIMFVHKNDVGYLAI